MDGVNLLEASVGVEGDDNFSTVSLSTMSLPEWDHDTDNGIAEGLHGITDAHSVKTGLPPDEETGTIGQLFYNARNRIEEWRMSAAQEEELMKPVPCWLGCGFEEAVEGVAMHVRDLCPFRAKECRQCHGIYKFAELQDHMEKDCLKRKVGCANAYSGCKEMVNFDFVFQHETLRCRYRKVPCRLNCGGEIPYCLRDNHENEHCNKRGLECDQCKSMVHAAQFGKHLKNECVERYVKCRISCGHSFKFKLLAAHEKNVCVAPCKWGCLRVIGPEQRRHLHELLQCKKRPVSCNYHCGMGGLTQEFLKEHEEQQCPEYVCVCVCMCVCVCASSDLSHSLTHSLPSTTTTIGTSCAAPTAVATGCNARTWKSIWIRGTAHAMRGWCAVRQTWWASKYW